MMSKADFYLSDLASKFRKIDPMKYYLSYSGGKDSHLLYWFLKTWLPTNYPDMKDYAKIPIVSVNTRMEWPEILDRMIKNADVILTPKMFPHEVVAKFGTPCFSKIKDEFISRFQHGSRSSKLITMVDGIKHREVNGKMVRSKFSLTSKISKLLINEELPFISPKCCNFLKKIPNIDFQKKTGLNLILGITSDEGVGRKVAYKSCFDKKGKFTPLWDLTEKLENEIYQQYHIEIPGIYNYINRTGCAGCPYGIWNGDTEKELALMTPAKKKYVCELFADAYRIRGVDIHKPLQTVLADYIQQYEEGKE